MKIYAPDFHKDFHCLAGACPDSCCRQGWQIVIDPRHLALYRTLEGPLGSRVNSALIQEEGDWSFRMECGVCALLEKDGLCPLQKELGEDALCSICGSHPRFVEEYGGTRELHYSLSCPEAARLSLQRTEPIGFVTEMTEEEVTCPNTIDPEEYLMLLEVREYAISLAQYRFLNVYDRMALLLSLAKRLQPLMEDRKYELCKQIIRWFSDHPGRHLAASRRKRKKGGNWFAERQLLLSLEHLTDEFPALVHQAVFTAKDGRDFDSRCQVTMEQLLTLWLSHYILKAVCDGRLDSKIRFAVFMALTVRRLCLCGEESPEYAAKMAGLLAKEIEHSEENRDRLFRVLEKDDWHQQLLKQLGE